jgi:CHAD domain-containing protein
MIEQGTFKYVIQDYFSKYLEQFRQNLGKAMEEYDPEAIHEYRVAVKRLRSIVRALDRVYEEPLFPAKMINPLRIMFKAGGTIRDDQVQTGLVEKIEVRHGRPFPLIKAYYQKRIEEQRDAFFIQSVDFDYEALDAIYSTINDTIGPLDDAHLELMLYQQLHKSMEKLKRKRYDLHEPDKLHKFRTRFKENGYIAEMVYHSQYSHKVTKATYNRMKNFGQELGNWHDHYQLWSKTSVIFHESKDIALLEEAFELRKLITPIHDKLFQEILHLIKRDDTIFIV